MAKKIVAVNAGPRKGWNTDTLIAKAAEGARSAGAEVIEFDLFRLEKYTGCISCFGCKKNQFKGHCIRKDGLTPVLDAIREADGLIIGSPNYLGELLLWAGVFIAGIPYLQGALQWIIAILGLVGITYVMFSGARRLEMRQDRNYGDDPVYQKYVKTVPIMIPLIPLYSVKNWKAFVA